MEGNGTGQIFQHHFESDSSEDEELNEETFGLTDDIELNDDWETKHEQLAKLLEIEHEQIKKSAPLQIASQRNDYRQNPTSNNLSDDEEEKIIGNSISQLRMDDEEEYLVRKHAAHLHNFEFQESEESWTSPSRGKEQLSDSLHELISPGEGVWASPTRAMLRGDDHIVPDSQKEREDVIKKLFGGHEVVTAKKESAKQSSMQPIRVEDLERGLRPEDEEKPSFMDITNSTIPTTPIHPLMHIPLGTPPTGLPMPSMTPKFYKPLPGVAEMNMASLLMLNQPLFNLGGIPGMPPLYHQLHAPPPMMPQMPWGRENIRSQHPNRGYTRGGGLRYSHRGHGNYRHQNNDRTWHRGSRQSASTDPSQFAHEQFIKMEPSKMMTAKEKEWIFKISLMSLLSGDPNISDYYFVSYMNKKIIKKAMESSDEKKSDDDEDVNENLEKTKKLMNYAQKQQQAKESHRPVKFEGSLGKLSITSVHHPRQIMDFSTPENERSQSRVPESGKKKFVMYGLIEKIYSIFLSLSDVERHLIDASPEQQDVILKNRSDKINKIFDLFQVKLHTSHETTDTDFFLHLMSISKTRKLLTRTFLYFTQEQSESFLVTILHVLPALLKKDHKEEILLQMNEKIKIILKKSNDAFKIKTVQMIRKINLKMLLSYKLSIKLLTAILDSLKRNNGLAGLEWSFYHDDVPKVVMDLSADVKKSNRNELSQLKLVLGVEDLLVKIDG